MVMYVFAGCAEVFLRILVEGSLATQRAEVIGLSFVFRRPRCSGGIDIHVADWIVYGGCHNVPSIPVKDC